jgi:group I intron endonuclease
MSAFIWIPKDVIYYLNLHLPRVIKALQYRFRKSAVVYAFRCQVNNMVYVGSSFIPARRFNQHLVTGHNSNEALQADIKAQGLQKFTAYVFEEVEFPKGLDYNEKRIHLRSLEQSYMDKFPTAQLYNSCRSSI